MCCLPVQILLSQGHIPFQRCNTSLYTLYKKRSRVSLNIYLPQSNFRSYASEQYDTLVKHLIKKKIVLMLPACTNQVQSLELSVKKSFKNIIREQLEKTPWWESKVDWCVYKELTVFETRVLITKWVTNVWS